MGNSGRIENIISLSNIDISENKIRKEMPGILDILLIDRTLSNSKKKKNIIWANENYILKGFKDYAPTAHIKPSLITDKNAKLIMPRALKNKEIQKQRTKSNAEVFTPLRVVKKQNDILEQDYMNDDLETYIKRKWLEVSCGEGPYMATRYDVESGKSVPINERVGFVDRKLNRINKEVDDKAEWQRFVEWAFKSSYGFEWNGDSLLLARENLLYTYIDYYIEKWSREPLYGLLEKIAEIISYNVFQMDGIAKKQGIPKKSSGLYYVLPLTERKEKNPEVQLSFDFMFDEEIEDNESKEFITLPGKRAKIMDWETKKLEYFDKGVK